jgi:hypothetical protein
MPKRGTPIRFVAEAGDEDEASGEMFSTMRQTGEGLPFWGNFEVVEWVAIRELVRDAGMATVMSPTMALLETSAPQGVVLCSYLTARAESFAAHGYGVGRRGHQLRKGLRGNQWASRPRPPSFRRLGKDQHEDTGASKELAQGASFAGGPGVLSLALMPSISSVGARACWMCSPTPWGIGLDLAAWRPCEPAHGEPTTATL